MNFAKNNFRRPRCNEMATTMKTAEERLRWALEICRNAQMRATPVREAILFFLATQRLPVSLETVSRSEKIHGRCNATTIYRTLMMFKEAGIVRLVGTPQKASYFLLNAPGQKNHFLICRRCGCTTELPLPESMCKSISQIAAAQGFSTAEQDCEVYGYCQTCHTVRQKETAPSKLSV